MIRKILYFEAFMMLLCISLKAQSLSPITISSGGGFYSAVGNSLSFTIAEMTMVQTFIQPTNMLTQGFQQPEQLTTAIAENETIPGEVIVYPNPSNGPFSISLNALNDEDYQVNIYNLVGQIVYAQSYRGVFGPNIITFDLGKFEQGVYILELRSTDSNAKHKKSIHRINLVY
jgi:hypothetical protein